LALAPGDEVLSTDHEYGAMERAWQFVCAKQGANFVQQAILLPCRSREQLVESVWSGVTRRTRVLFLSHISSPTALIFPIAELIRRAREKQIITVIDGAHAPGQIPLNLESLGADFYVGNCHKWMLAPKGSGFLFARPEMQSLLEPLIVSWGWQAEEPGPSRFVDEQEYQGTRDIAAFLTVPAAIDFMAEHNWNVVQKQCHSMLCQVLDAISQLTGLPPVTSTPEDWVVQMGSAFLPGCDAAALQRRLYERYAIEIPVVSWNGNTLIRVSVQGYNSQDDLMHLIDALDRELRDILRTGPVST
jgi:isopenicillin-N epimerase